MGIDMSKPMYQQRNDAVGMINQGYELIKQENAEAEAAKTVDIDLSGGGQQQALSSEEQSEVINTLSTAVVELTERLNKMQEGGTAE